MIRLKGCTLDYFMGESMENTSIENLTEMTKNGTENIPFVGRKRILCHNTRITSQNVVEAALKALLIHFENVVAENYLYYYARGIQPVLNKQKDVRPEINHKLTQNLASEIVSFKNGYFLTKPSFYISRRKDESKSEVINKLNDYLYLSGKQDADNELVDWFHTVGLGTLFVESVDDEEAPVKCYAIDPTTAFVAYSRTPSSEPIFGGHVVYEAYSENNVQMMKVYYDVYTKDKIFRLEGTAKAETMTREVIANIPWGIASEEINHLGEIPIIEYQYDYHRMGSFEKVLSLMNELNYQQSMRLDSTEQFVNSLLVFYNCKLGKDEKGNDITPSYIRQNGALFLKSEGQDKADVMEIASVLDQSQSQVLVDNLTEQIFDIAGVPMSQKINGGTGDNVGAVYLRSGWATADTFARNTEDLFRKSNKQFDKIFLKILKEKKLIDDILVSDLDLQFTRNEMENMVAKTQAALNLKTLGLSPELVLSKSGISNDPAGDIEKSREYIERAYAPQKEATSDFESGSDNDNRNSVD